MANTFEGVLDNNVANDAEFQAWCQTIETAILASGFLEVAPDTGQLNLATATRPLAGAYSGYRIYRGKDSVQATRPIYIKVEYGAGSGGVDRPSIRRTVGTGTNGAGTLTGPQLAAASNNPSATGGGAATIIAGGGSSAMFIYIKDPSSSSHDLWWVCGRLRDQADGSASPEILFDNFVSVSFLIMGSYSWTDGVAAWVNATSGLADHFPQLNNAINTGGNINTVRVFQALVYRNAKTLVFPMVTGKTAELPYTTPTDSKFSIAIWGGNHTFVPLIPNAGASAQRTAWLWE